MKSKTKSPARISLNPITIGNAVLIRTVTHYHVGRIAEIHDKELVLTDAAWVADTGRFSDALADGSFNEAEPFAGPVAVSRGSIVDVTGWKGTIPLAKK